VENLGTEEVTTAQMTLHEKVQRNQTALEKKLENNNSEPLKCTDMVKCTDMEGAVENVGQKEVAPAQTTLHEGKVKGNQTVLGKLGDNNSEALNCTEVDGAVESLVKVEVPPVRTTLHEEKNTMPRRHTCHIRSSSGTSGSLRAGCNIRSSSGNWHAGAFKNSLKAKSPVTPVRRSFEDSSSHSLKSAGEELRQVLSTERSCQSLSDSRPPCTSSSPSLKSAGEEVQQVLSRDTEKSRQSLSDSRPPYTPRKNMLGSHSPREGVVQGYNPAVPLGSVTPESHKSVEPCTVEPRTPNVGMPQGNSTSVPFGSVTPESHKSVEPCTSNVGKTQGNTTAVPSESVTPDLHKLVEPRTPIMSMGERIRRFEPRSGGR